MIKVTNIQVARIIGVLLILLSGDAFAVTYATQPALNTEISNRKSGDSIETARAKAAEGTLRAADTAETARAKVAEGTLKTADTAETARATKAEGALDTAIAAETTRATGAEGTLTTAINAETARAKAAEATASCTPYSIGETGPDGGIVAYVDGTGCHGLEAQPHDVGAMSEYPWLGPQLIWNDAIISAAAYNTTKTNTVAGYSCSTTLPSDTLLRPYCWHLPSKTEFNLLVEQLELMLMPFDDYWTSTTITVPESQEPYKHLEVPIYNISTYLYINVLPSTANTYHAKAVRAF